MPDIATIFLHILSALLGGGLVGLLMYPAIKRKTDAESGKLAAESWVMLVNQLRDRVKTLEDERVSDKQRIVDLEIELNGLRDWIKKQGLTPPPRKIRRR